MVNGGAVEHACTLAKQFELDTGKQFSCGLHFNLTEGNYISQPNEMMFTKLQFYQQIAMLLPTDVNYQQTKLQIIEELKAQIELFKKLLGRLPTHIDGHNHIQVHKQIYRKKTKKNIKYKTVVRYLIRIQTKQLQTDTMLNVMIC
jgi:predicted glycoside hydrolase/deacetylase ChbG (UPF0249 family)